jgi:hypothetical protein
MKTDDIDVLMLIWDDYYVYYETQETIIEILAVYHQKENFVK